MQRRVEVQLTLPEYIYNAIFRIELFSKSNNASDLEREVRIAIELPDGRLLREVEELVSSTGRVAKNLRLNPADHLAFGDTIAVVVRDAQTGEELDRKTAIVRVELDL